MNYWQNKVAVVTGGSAGLGREIAAVLARRGAKVVIAARQAEQLADTTEVLRGEGLEVTGIPADVTQQVQVEALIDGTVATYGRLDLLVNNVGRSTRSSVLETTPEMFRELMEVNFLSQVRCTRAAMPHLVKAKGHLVNIGSLSAKTVSPYLCAYAASKFAVAAYSQQLRVEGPPEVHVLLVCPGPIAREDAGGRYDQQAGDLPEQARRPGGGAKLKGVCPKKLAARILRACENHKAELIVPLKAKVLFVVAQIWPKLGDWLLGKFTN